MISMTRRGDDLRGKNRGSGADVRKTLIRTKGVGAMLPALQPEVASEARFPAVSEALWRCVAGRGGRKSPAKSRKQNAGKN
jgi:hypothetical protein